MDKYIAAKIDKEIVVGEVIFFRRRFAMLPIVEIWDSKENSF